MSRSHGTTGDGVVPRTQLRAEDCQLIADLTGFDFDGWSKLGDLAGRIHLSEDEFGRLFRSFKQTLVANEAHAVLADFLEVVAEFGDPGRHRIERLDLAHILSSEVPWLRGAGLKVVGRLAAHPRPGALP